MQATLLHVLHAPAHAHAPRGAPGHETAADERGFSQALTSASERIDGSLDDAPDPAGAQADHGEASPDTDDVPDRAATLAQADTPHAKDSDAAASLPVWLAGLTRRAEPAAQASPAGRVESGADAPILPTPAGAAANGMSRQARPGIVRPDARGAYPARGTGSLPDDAGDASARAASAAPSRANAPQDRASDRSDEAREAGLAAESVPVGSAPDAVARKSPFEAAARDDKGVDRTVAAASAAARRHAADTEPRPRDTTGTANAPAPEARAVSTRARSPEEGSPATDALPGAPATSRPPEPVPAAARAQENGAPQITRAPESNPSTTTLTAVPTGVTPQLPPTTPLASRWRGAAGPATPGEGTRALAAPAERLRQEVFFSASPGDAQNAPRLPGLEAGSAPAATQASSWMQALDAATRQAGGDSLRAGATEMPAPPGVPTATVEAGGRPEPSSPTEGMPSSRIDAPPDSPQFPGLLGARVATMVRDGIEQARIALNPQEMGPVSVQIELSGTQVRVDLAAEVEATRVALEQALPALAGSLREAGFTLAGGGVFQQARDGSPGQTADGGSGGGGSAAPSSAPAETAAPSRAPLPRGIVDLYA